MPPQIWKGTLTFGLVTIPVRIESAVRADERVSFRQLHKDDLAPIRYQRVCQRDGEPVEWADVVKGYEYEKDRFVVVTEEELDSVRPRSSKTIDILDFVPASAIDARYFDRPYFLVPDAGGERAYALLREAIRETAMVGIGKVTMRQHGHLVAIKVVGEALVLEIMRFAAELVDVATLSFPSAESVRPQELTMARQLVMNLATEFDATRYADDYQVALMKLIRAKLKGKKIEIEEPEAPEATRVVDIMERLRASLEQTKGGRAGARRRARGAAASAKPARRRKTA
jgi:DNA end-binding protein Ku